MAIQGWMASHQLTSPRLFASLFSKPFRMQVDHTARGMCEERKVTARQEGTDVGHDYRLQSVIFCPSVVVPIKQ